jgi:hypothetical protein
MIKKQITPEKAASARTPIKDFFTRLGSNLNVFAKIRNARTATAERRERRGSKSTYVMNVSKEDQEIIKQIATTTEHILAERPLSITVSMNGISETIDLIGQPPPPYYPPKPGMWKRAGKAVLNFFAKIELPEGKVPPFRYVHWDDTNWF